MSVTNDSVMHKMLVNLFHGQIVPSLMSIPGTVVTYNKLRPSHCEIKKLDRGRVYPLGTVEIGNPSIRYTGEGDNRKVLDVMSKYPVNVVGKKRRYQL